MPPTQAHRPVAIETPLGPDALLVKGFTVNELLSRPYQIEVEVVSSDGNVDFNAIVGGNATIRLDISQDVTRYFNGFVSRFVQTKQDRSFSHFRATLVPWLWFLTRTSDCRIFQEKKIPDIIEEVFQDAGFSDYELSLTGTYREWNYCVQYRETDFNFVSRLMEQEGIYYYFKHENGKHTMVLADSINAHAAYETYSELPYRPPVDEIPDVECVTDWLVEQSVQPGTYALTDFDFEKPKASLLAKSNVTRDHASADFEMFDYPGEYKIYEEGEAYSKVRIEELQAQHEVLHGQATARGLCAGYTFTLKDHPRGDQNREYLILGTSLRLQGMEYESGASGNSENPYFACEFTAMDSQTPYRARRLTPKPLIQGPQTAIVVGKKGEEIHTDEFGRVIVQFHWDRYGKADENSSCWVRVAQNWAGKKWGSIYTPRIGQEVIVEFLEGDPDRPIITGRVYNGESMPPYELPAEKTKSTLKSSSSKGGGGFNEIRFEDKKGEEEVFIHGEKNLEIRVKNDTHEWVGNDRHLLVANDRVEKVENNRSQTTSGEHKEVIGKDRHLKVAGLEAKEVGGSLSLKVDGDVVEQFKSNHSEEVDASYFLKADGAIVLESSQGITLKCGGNNVVIDSSGVTIKGSLVTVDGNMVKVASGPGSPAGSGSPGALEMPLSPDEPVEAAVADPGEMAEIAAEQAEKRPTEPAYHEVEGTTFYNLEEEDDETSWISFELKDEDGTPMANEPYRIKLPDGSIREGSLDGEGQARVAGFKRGECEICFPRIDEDEWRPA